MSRKALGCNKYRNTQWGGVEGEGCVLFERHAHIKRMEETLPQKGGDHAVLWLVCRGAFDEQTQETSVGSNSRTRGFCQSVYLNSSLAKFTRSDLHAQVSPLKFLPQAVRCKRIGAGATIRNQGHGHERAARDVPDPELGRNNGESSLPVPAGGVEVVHLTRRHESKIGLIKSETEIAKGVLGNRTFRVHILLRSTLLPRTAYSSLPPFYHVLWRSSSLTVILQKWYEPTSVSENTPLQCLNFQHERGGATKPQHAAGMPSCGIRNEQHRLLT